MLAVWLDTVTATLLAPALPEGTMQLIDVGLSTVTPMAATPPIVTVDPDAKFEPEMVTPLPPAIDPLAGEMDEIVGAGAR